ncbi:hypothetical protein MKC66_13930 [[Clostridium] innocuum]|nr:hypothetical protein [[Clostridium] innocuum]
MEIRSDTSFEKDKSGNEPNQYHDISDSKSMQLDCSFSSFHFLQSPAKKVDFQNNSNEDFIGISSCFLYNKREAILHIKRKWRIIYERNDDCDMEDGV